MVRVSGAGNEAHDNNVTSYTFQRQLLYLLKFVAMLGERAHCYGAPRRPRYGLGSLNWPCFESRRPYGRLGAHSPCLRHTP